MSDATRASFLKIDLFGAFHASRNGTPIHGLHLREGERLLAYLILKSGEPVTRRELAKRFWPSEAQMSPVGQDDFPSVRQALYSLRQALGNDAFRLTRPQRGTVAFDLTDAVVDVSDFDRGTRKEGDGAPDAWKAAVGLYQGPLLNGWGEIWAAEVRTQKKRAYEHTLRRLAGHALSQQDAVSAERWMRLLLVSRPDDEATARDFLFLLNTGKRYAEAEAVLATLEDAVKKAGRTLDTGLLAIAAPPTNSPPQPEFAVLSPLDEPAGGAVSPDSAFYVARDTDPQFHAALARRDGIVLIKGARQVGKTSLLARGLQKVRASGVSRVITTDFQQFNEAQFATPNALYLAIATAIAVQLELDVSPRRVWNSDYSPNMNLEQFLRRHVLRAFPEPVVWGMDEVDRLFAHPYSGEVFGLFRSWHNGRSLDPSGPWSRLTLAIAYATEAHLFITDLNQSPFNVGTRLTLDDFTQQHVAHLNALYGAPLTPAETAGFHELVGGQPYLVRRGLDEIARRGLRLDVLEADVRQDGGIFSDHLRRLVTALSRSPELLQAVREMIGGRPCCASAATFYRLRTAGIVSGTFSQDAQFRCPLYAAYFAAHLT